MFSLPQPATDIRHTPQDSRPIVVLAEHSEVLAVLLLTIYLPTQVSAWVGPLSLHDHIAALAWLENMTWPLLPTVSS